ncbi:hypothetical protein MSAN_00472500 [Mycena sanguinolenta]|uniref:Uncharacterized protein n=1 Tax=Mycena sanguinolenta TaxID=230812 RepID=A0A8H6ZFA7_9AGAR|nr:hypothetical protein MSAN_00472500 [Mycena sanguinolenta]
MLLAPFPSVLPATSSILDFNLRIISPSLLFPTLPRNTLTHTHTHANASSSFPSSLDPPRSLALAISSSRSTAFSFDVCSRNLLVSSLPASVFSSPTEAQDLVEWRSSRILARILFNAPLKLLLPVAHFLLFLLFAPHRPHHLCCS